MIRSITFNGQNSFADYGLRINSERSDGAGAAKQRTAAASVPYRDGDIVQPAGLESAMLTYCFIIVGSGRAECEAQIRAVTLWLTSAKGDLTDSDFAGKKFTNVCASDKPEIQWVSNNFTRAYMTVRLTADPIMQDVSVVNERILKLTANGAATLTITNNSAYSITAGGATTTGSYTAAEPYKYRLEAYTETAATITLNGTGISAGEIFTMPASAEIVLSWTGYGYVELWHDTRTEVRI